MALRASQGVRPRDVMVNKYVITPAAMPSQKESFRLTQIKLYMDL